MLTLKNLEPDSDAYGSKAAGLAQIRNAGLSVPAGLVITPFAVKYVLDNGAYAGLGRFMDDGLRELDRHRRQSSSRPLLVSVRSGAAVSMPGMMDTILNVGLTPQTVERVAQLYGEEFAYDLYARFLVQFGTLALGISPSAFDSPLPSGKARIDELRLTIFKQTRRPMIDDLRRQLEVAILAVGRSWNSERAIAYRQEHGISDDIGTAVIIQEMYFGNAPGGKSCSGVVLSRNPATGENEMAGEYVVAQGDEIVSGRITPLPIEQLQLNMPKAFFELQAGVKKLEAKLRKVVEVEFTVENDQLVFLQVRGARLQAKAAAKTAVDMVREGLITQSAALDLTRNLPRSFPVFEPVALDHALSNGGVLSRGLAASSGVAVGEAVFCPKKAVDWRKEGRNPILLRPDTSPDDFAGMLAADAFVTGRGGTTCHAAVVARGLGRPAVVAAKELFQHGSVTGVVEGEIVSVDGNTGAVFRGELPIRETVMDESFATLAKWKGELGDDKPRIRYPLRDQFFNGNDLLIDFYLTSLLDKELAGTPLEAVAAELRLSTHQYIADVLAMYLFIAVAGEARYYVWSKPFSSPDSTDYQNLRGGVKSVEDLPFTKALREFQVEYSNDRAPAQLKVLEYLSNAPLQQIIEFVDLVAKAFAEPRFKGTSVAGNLWAVIAETLAAYLKGEIPVSLFVDRVFDLRHNGGQLFDKHPMLRSKTNERRLKEQLDAKQKARNLQRLIANPLFRSQSEDVKTLLRRWERLNNGKQQRGNTPRAAHIQGAPVQA